MINTGTLFSEALVGRQSQELYLIFKNDNIKDACFSFAIHWIDVGDILGQIKYFTEVLDLLRGELPLKP